MKVLVAEDSSVSQRILKNYLEKWGYDFVLTDDGAKAWELLQREDFPLVLTDWLMPEMDGLELIRRIREREGDIPYIYVILLTSKSQKEDLVEAMDAGADDFLSKPFDRDELRVRLREGERVVGLERTLADQYRKLRLAQEQLGEHEPLALLGKKITRVTQEILALLDQAQAAMASTSSDSERQTQLLNELYGTHQRIRSLVQSLEAVSLPENGTEEPS